MLRGRSAKMLMMTTSTGCNGRWSLPAVRYWRRKRRRKGRRRPLFQRPQLCCAGCWLPPPQISPPPAMMQLLTLLLLLPVVVVVAVGCCCWRPLAEWSALEKRRLQLKQTAEMMTAAAAAGRCPPPPPEESLDNARQLLQDYCHPPLQRKMPAESSAAADWACCFRRCCRQRAPAPFEQR